MNVPDRATQERIASAIQPFIIHTISHEALCVEKSKFKYGLMQDLLTGRRRLPGFKKGPWQKVRLGSVFDERHDLGHPALPLLAVTGAMGIVPRDDVARRDSSSADKSRYKRILPGDIGYNTMRMWQGVSGLSKYEGIVSPAYTVVVPTSERLDGAFASHLFKLPSVINSFRRQSQGLVADTLNLKFPVFANIVVAIPGITEQRRIASMLDLCDLEIALLTTQGNELRRLTRALIDRLLSGSSELAR